MTYSVDQTVIYAPRKRGGTVYKAKLPPCSDSYVRAVNPHKGRKGLWEGIREDRRKTAVMFSLPQWQALETIAGAQGLSFAAAVRMVVDVGLKTQNEG